MTINGTLKTAFKAINSNKIRAGLTILGVVIGVFAVVTLISLGRGIQNYITDEFNKLGSNLIFVSPGNSDFGSDPAAAFSNNKLAEKHIKLIEQYAADFADGVFPYIVSSKSVSYRTYSYLADLQGISSEGTAAFNYEIDLGRNFTKSEERSGAKVLVIGPQVLSELFPNRNTIGERVRIDNESFEVIGTFKSKGQNYDKGILLPYTTMEKVFNIRNYSSIAIKVRDASSVDRTMRQVELALLRDLNEDDFDVLSQSDILSSIQNILGTLTLGLGAIAGISLLVGGIGIMNIMLVSVTERVSEIGLRKAIGATPRDIALQFLSESVILSVFGGSVGLILGFLATLAAQSFIRAEITLSAVLVAFLFSVVVGVLFGTYPAIQAAKKDPIESLRHEL